MKLPAITITDPERPGRVMRVMDDSPAHVADILALRAHCERTATAHHEAWTARPQTHPSDGTHERLLADAGGSPVCRTIKQHENPGLLQLNGAPFIHLHPLYSGSITEPDIAAITRLAAALTARKSARQPAPAQAGTAHVAAKPARVERRVSPPAPVPAPTRSDRPTCERCGKVFRRSGVGLAWHRANNPHCTRRLAVAS